MARSAASVGLSEVISHFEELEDPRSTINRLHPLPSVLTISLMAVLAGADGPTGIYKWAVLKENLLLQALDLPHGIPSRDVIRRVLCALKGNQDSLHQQAIDYIEQHISNDFAGVPSQRLDEKEKKGHGRIDSRTYIQFNVPNTFTGKSRWKNLRTIGVVVYKSIVKGEQKIEIRYFISSLPLGIQQFSKVVRKHWGIETTCHWSLDVTYGEDGLRTRRRTIAENMAWIRRFTLSLLKQHPGKESIVMKRRMCGWNDDFLMQVLGITSI